MDALADFDYAYDKLGNLTYRADGFGGLFERFCYDALNRLTASALAAGSDPGTNCAALGGTVKTIGYDAIGDITNKSDAGTYSYPASGAGSVRPHAVGGITGTVNGVVNPSYSYDADGFMTAGAGRTITPTSFDMAGTIVQGATTVTLRYDGDHQRAYQTTGTTTTIYENDPASGAMEEVQAAGTTYTYQDYLKVDGHVVALRSCTASSFAACTATPTWTYVVTDQLGSTAVLTNASGTAIERDSTDPWGRPRVYATGADDASCGTSPPSATTHHFTGHESIASACLVNANARLYDPAIGRFLAADTMVSDALDGQAFNHFSYVNNGPLSATDPSGHMPTETITDTGIRIPRFGDSSDMPSGMLSSGGRGTAGSGYGATIQRAFVPMLVPATITGTRIPGYRLKYVPVLIITEQGENSDSSDTDAADNAEGSDNALDTSDSDPKLKAARHLAFETLPYGGKTGYDVLIYKKGNDYLVSDPFPEICNGKDCTGSATVDLNNGGPVLTVSGFYGVDGSYPIVEIPHTHPKPRDKGFGTDNDDGFMKESPPDYNIAKAWNVISSYRFDDSIYLFNPAIDHGAKNEYGNDIPVAGHQICHGAKCFQ